MTTRSGRIAGTPEQIAATAKAYRAFYSKTPLDDGTYTIDHAASAMLFDADGSYAGAIAHDEPDDAARAKIAALLAANRNPPR